MFVNFTKLIIYFLRFKILNKKLKFKNVFYIFTLHTIISNYFISSFTKINYKLIIND